MFADASSTRGTRRPTVHVLGWVGTACGLVASLAATTPVVAQPATNAILFIGDGVDDHQLTIGRNYLSGASGEFVFDHFPYRASARVVTVKESPPGEPEYVGDSASGGTALATGRVTSRGRIATSAGADRDLPTLVELAAARGLRTGIVTTSSVTDATPASFAAHVSFRYCQGPSDMDSSRRGLLPGCPGDKLSAGGPGSIVQQLVRSGVEVLWGGGMEHFEQSDELGRSILGTARAEGFSVLTSANQLQTVSGRTLGLFAADNLPVLWRGRGGLTAQPLRVEDGAVEEPPVFDCEPAPDFKGTPTLEQMTRAAIELGASTTNETTGISN